MRAPSVAGRSPRRNRSELAADLAAPHLARTSSVASKSMSSAGGSAVSLLAGSSRREHARASVASTMRRSVRHAPSPLSRRAGGARRGRRDSERRRRRPRPRSWRPASAPRRQVGELHLQEVAIEQLGAAASPSLRDTPCAPHRVSPSATWMSPLISAMRPANWPGFGTFSSASASLILLAIREHAREPQARDHRELGIVALLHREAQLLGGACRARVTTSALATSKRGLVRVGVLGILAAQLRERRFRRGRVAVVGSLLTDAYNARRGFGLAILVREVLVVAVQSEQADRHAADQEPAVLAPPVRAAARLALCLTNTRPHDPPAGNERAILCRRARLAEQVDAFFDRHEPLGLVLAQRLDADLAGRELGLPDDQGEPGPALVGPPQLGLEPGCRRADRRASAPAGAREAARRA